MAGHRPNVAHRAYLTLLHRAIAHEVHRSEFLRKTSELAADVLLDDLLIGEVGEVLIGNPARGTRGMTQGPAAEEHSNWGVAAQEYRRAANWLVSEGDYDGARDLFGKAAEMYLRQSTRTVDELGIAYSQGEALTVIEELALRCRRISSNAQDVFKLWRTVLDRVDFLYDPLVRALRAEARGDPCTFRKL